jgi:hypothetical protein
MKQHFPHLLASSISVEHFLNSSPLCHDYENTRLKESYFSVNQVLIFKDYVLRFLLS